MSVTGRYSPKISACGASMATLVTLVTLRTSLVSKGDNDLLESYHPLA